MSGIKFLNRLFFKIGIFFPVIMGMICPGSVSAAEDLDTKTLLLMQNQAGFPNSTVYPNKQPSSGNENSIDPDRYYIGGGDEFQISAIGMPSIRYTTTINSAGDLYIPELGLEKLGKIVLSEALIKIKKFVQSKLKNKNEIYVSLTKAKNTVVTVSGAVTNPGTYTFSGGYRLFDALRAANDNKPFSMNNCNFREVACVNRDSIAIIDLFGFLLKKDPSSNPYLFPGDIISLPYTTNKVLVNCNIKTGIWGWYPIKKDETLSQFLSYLTFDPSVDTSEIILQTNNNSDRIIRTVLWQEASSVTLCDNDIITIRERKNYSKVSLIYIGGEVVRPGTYPILMDSSTIGDILSFAGGPTIYSNLERAVIIRMSKIQQGKLAQERGKEKSGEMAFVRPEKAAGFKEMVVMNDFSIIEFGKIGSAVKLIEDDRIIIPRKDGFIYLSGCVIKPGAVEFKAGKTKDYYIKKAGGFSKKADKRNMFGVRYFENATQMTDLSTIVEGDIIVVPESQQDKYFTTVLIPVFSLLLSTIGTIITIYALTNK